MRKQVCNLIKYIQLYFHASRIHQIPKEHILPRDMKTPTEFTNGVSVNIFRVY